MTTALSSGRLLHYDHVDVPGKGGAFTAHFSSEPTKEDIAEATAFLETQIPRGGSMTLAHLAQGDEGRQLHSRIVDAMVTKMRGGSKN